MGRLGLGLTRAYCKLSRSQYFQGFSPAPQLQQAIDVVREGGEPFRDGPEPIQPQRIHRHAPERGQDLNADRLAEAVRVHPQLGIAGPVPRVFRRRQASAKRYDQRSRTCSSRALAPVGKLVT
jgi:hypothetical protein